MTQSLTDLEVQIQDTILIPDTKRLKTAKNVTSMV